MKTQVWVYIVIVVLAVGAGVAIAGVPNSVPRDPTIEVPAATDVIEAAEAPAPDPTDAPVSSPIEDESAETPSTEIDPDPTTTATTTTTTTTTTTAPTTTSAPTPTLPLPARSEIDVSVVNGANVAGAATQVSNALEDLGYVDVGSLDGIDIVDATVIFAAEGFQGPADRLADEIGIEPGRVFPIGALPDIDGVTTASVVVYLGRDVVLLPIFA